MNKKKGFIIYKCKNYNATTIPFLLSCKLLNQLKDIESLIEDGGRGVAYQTYCSFFFIQVKIWTQFEFYTD